VSRFSEGGQKKWGKGRRVKRNQSKGKRPSREVFAVKGGNGANGKTGGSSVAAQRKTQENSKKGWGDLGADGKEGICSGRGLRRDFEPKLPDERKEDKGDC